MYAEIAKRIRQAELNGQKIAMFHYQVLLHADQLAGVSAAEFCRLVGMKESFTTEYNKMMALAKLLKEQGVSIK